MKIHEIFCKKTLENTERIIKKGNPEKLATYSTQHEETESKNTTEYVLETTMGKQTQKRKQDTRPPTNNWRY